MCRETALIGDFGIPHHFYCLLGGEIASDYNYIANTQLRLGDLAFQFVHPLCAFPAVKRKKRGCRVALALSIVHTLLPPTISRWKYIYCAVAYIMLYCSKAPITNQLPHWSGLVVPPIVQSA